MRLRRGTAPALATVLVLAGCGKSDLVRVATPTHPRYVCWLWVPLKKAPGHRLGRSKPGCIDRFDANRLLGLTVADAQRLARARGYEMRALEEFNTADQIVNRLNVEASSSTASGIVTKIVDEG